MDIFNLNRRAKRIEFLIGFEHSMHGKIVDIWDGINEGYGNIFLCKFEDDVYTTYSGYDGFCDNFCTIECLPQDWARVTKDESQKAWSRNNEEKVESQDSHECNCDLSVIMCSGCQCGGT